MAISPEATEFVIAKLEAKRSATLIQVAALIGAVGCIIGAAALQTPINTQRKELQLVLNSNIYKELPPEYAWVSATGGTFRGLAADILWMRAEKLKEEGKYYELHQLAKWICTLQPRFATVWSFQAWNMAYNISVATHTAQERWQWVYNGIRLLRDEGIPNNERILPLYHQLSWTWFHKVGDRLDDFHMAYKRAWAATMDTLIGAPPLGISSREAIDWFRPIAQAPRRIEEVIAARPSVQKLVDAFTAAGIDFDADTDNQNLFHPLEESFFRPYKAFRIDQSMAGLRKNAPQFTPQQEQLFAIFRDAPPEDFNLLLAYLRAKVLREQYKMDPQYMLAMTGMLGTPEPLPIDWRTPWSQGLYWALYGTDKSRVLKNLKEFDQLANDRVMLFALKTLAKSGRVFFRINLDEPMDSFLNMLPDPRYIEAMHLKYIEMGKKHAEPGEEVGQTAGETLRSGHVNELHEAIVNLYFAGRVDEARKYLEYLAINYTDMYSKEVQEQYLQNVDDFVHGQFKEMSEGYAAANSIIYSLLANGYFALGSGFGDEFTAAVRNAILIYDNYQKDKLTDREGRRTLPPFARMRAEALGAFVTDTQYPIALRAAIWSREQNDVKQRCYDMVLPYLTAQCEVENVDLAKAFPEPEGMEQWRKDNPKLEQAEDVIEKEKPQ